MTKQIQDILHVANTSVETELEESNPLPLEIYLTSHPLYLQLQFLPFVYGNEQESVFTTTLPTERYIENLIRLGFSPPQSTLSPHPQTLLEPWGISSAIIRFQQANNLFLQAPSVNVVKQVNSKAFSFVHSPPLHNAALIHNHDELALWYKHCPGAKVLKSCFGVSGKGHVHVKKLEDLPLKAFVEREWSKNLPIIGEPWVDRILDFSTQWFVTQEGKIKHLGTTICENDPYGHYRGTVVCRKEELLGIPRSCFEKHYQEALHVLHTMYRMGFFGFVGIDAMIYNEGLLHPIVEINARKTMGFVALKLQNKLSSSIRDSSICRLFLTKKQNAQNPLLPEQIILPSGKTIHFPYQLSWEIITRPPYTKHKE